MRTAHDVLIRPIITEASTDALQLNKYTFEVAPWANKVQIRQAVEDIFKVHVVKVNTLWVRGKKRRRRQFVVKQPDWKKAIVTLKPGETIEVFNQ
jgi:large subunit ribosomal protein L23